MVATSNDDDDMEIGDDMGDGDGCEWPLLDCRLFAFIYINSSYLFCSV